jgi:hypothetical protein
MRRENVDAFTSGRARVLVATDAAGEGLNLQARCRLVINLELPWNPRRLEQRIGRVARIGQTRVVHALHLAHADSFEDDVLARVERRRASAAAALSVSGAADCGLLGPEHTVRRLSASLARGRTRPPRRHGAVVTTAPRRGLPATGCVLLYQCEMLDSAGRIVQRELIPLRCACEGGAWTATARWRRLAADAGLRRCVNDEAARRAEQVAGQVAAFAASAERRLTDLLDAAGARTAARSFQASLFDRRAEQQAQTSEAARRQWQEHLGRLRERAVALRHIGASAPRLVAAWRVR